MNESQNSFASTSGKIDGEEGDDTKDLITPRSTGPASAGPSPAVAVPRSAGGSNIPPSTGAPSTHLSGLMCNVHRTTGKEPHPLVGATTTILGDKLYVFRWKDFIKVKADLDFRFIRVRPHSQELDKA